MKLPLFNADIQDLKEKEIAEEDMNSKELNIASSRQVLEDPIHSSQALLKGRYNT